MFYARTATGSEYAWDGHTLKVNGTAYKPLVFRIVPEEVGDEMIASRTPDFDALRDLPAPEDGEAPRPGDHLFFSSLHDWRLSSKVKKVIAGE